MAAMQLVAILLMVTGSQAVGISADSEYYGEAIICNEGRDVSEISSMADCPDLRFRVFSKELGVANLVAGAMGVSAEITAMHDPQPLYVNDYNGFVEMTISGDVMETLKGFIDQDIDNLKRESDDCVARVYFAIRNAYYSRLDVIMHADFRLADCGPTEMGDVSVDLTPLDMPIINQDPSSFSDIIFISLTSKLDIGISGDIPSKSPNADLCWPNSVLLYLTPREDVEATKGQLTMQDYPVLELALPPGYSGDKSSLRPIFPMPSLARPQPCGSMKLVALWNPYEDVQADSNPSNDFAVIDVNITCYPGAKDQYPYLELTPFPLDQGRTAFVRIFHEGDADEAYVVDHLKMTVDDMGTHVTSGLTQAERRGVPRLIAKQLLVQENAGVEPQRMAMDKMFMQVETIVGCKEAILNADFEAVKDTCKFPGLQGECPINGATTPHDLYIRIKEKIAKQEREESPEGPPCGPQTSEEDVLRVHQQYYLSYCWQNPYGQRVAMDLDHVFPDNYPEELRANCTVNRRGVQDRNTVHYVVNHHTKTIHREYMGTCKPVLTESCEDHFCKPPKEE